MSIIRVLLLFLMSLTIVFFSFLCSVSGCCVTSTGVFDFLGDYFKDLLVLSDFLLDSGYTRRVSVPAQSALVFWTFFLRSLVLGSYLFGAGLLEECLPGFFWETASGSIPVFSASWFDSGYGSLWKLCFRKQRNAWSSDSPVALGQRGRCPFEVVDIVVTPRQIHMVQTLQKTTEIPLFLVGKVIDVLVRRSCEFYRCHRGDSRFAQVHLVEKLAACSDL